MAVPNCVRDESESNIKPMKKKVSTALAVGDIVIIDSNGFIDKAAAGSAASAIVGICMRPVVSTDADYAVATPIEIDVFRKSNNGDTYRLQVETGTPAQTHVGETHDLTSNNKADLTATTTNVYKVQRILSSTEVLVTFVE